MNIFINEPNEKQKLFLMDRHKHIAFGGIEHDRSQWEKKEVRNSMRYKQCKRRRSSAPRSNRGAKRRRKRGEEWIYL